MRELEKKYIIEKYEECIKEAKRSYNNLTRLISFLKTELPIEFREKENLAKNLERTIKILSDAALCASGLQKDFNKIADKVISGEMHLEKETIDEED